MSGRGVIPGLLGVLLLVGAGPGGCSSEREVAVRLLGVGPQCGGAGAGPRARRLASATEVAAALSPGLGEPQATPAVDWGAEAVVLVAMGQRPTAGHGVELASRKAPVKDGAAGLRVTFSSPPAGALTAQVMTSPCLVVALPRQGLRAVAVLDGDRVVATLGLE